MSSETVIPRSKPRTPQLSVALVTTLARDLYGLHVQTCDELDSFVDRNYHLKADALNIHNDFIGKVCAEGYVLKILNSEDSNVPADVRTEAALLQHVHGRGLDTPRLVPTREGCPFVFCSFTGKGTQDSYEVAEEKEEKKHAVRLLEYLPGVPLASVPLTERLCYQLGLLAARLDTLLQDFDDSSHPIPGQHWSWKMENLAGLRHLLDVITDMTLKSEINDIIDAFVDRLLKSDAKDTFKRGYIHGDFSLHNILVSRVRKEDTCPETSSCQPPATVSSPRASSEKADTSSSSYSASSSFSSPFSSSSSSSLEEWNVSGLVDFGDMSKTYVLLEPAIAMSVVMLQCPVTEQADVYAGHVLCGYLSQVAVRKQEIELLPLVIRARMSQCLVLSRHTHRLDPHNHYVSAFLAPIQRHLSRLVHVPDDDMLGVWRNVADGWDLRFPDY